MNRRLILRGGVALAALGGAAAASFIGIGSSADYAASMARLRAPLTGNDDVTELIRFATLAANSHNTQPWLFRTAPGTIEIRPDFSRRTPAVDPDDHHLFASLGCAAENLSLAAAAVGLPGEADFDPATGALAFRYAPGLDKASPLCDAIPLRQSTRADFDGQPVAPAELDTLAAAATTPGVQLSLITDRAAIDRVRDLVMAGSDAQMADATFVRELKAWMRFNPAGALATGDGLYSAASGNPTLPTWLGAPLFDLVFTASAERGKYASQLNTSSGVAVFVADRPDPAGWVAAGRGCQRFALQATALGLKTSFVNQPVEVAALRGDLSELAGTPGRRPDILMRFGRGPDLPMSPRRPVEAVIQSA